MGNKKKEYQRRLKFINEDVKRLIESLPNDVLNMTVYGNYENINTLLSNIEIASNMEDDESLGWVDETKKIVVDPNLVINVPPVLREDFKEKDIDKMPNQKWHQIISFIKSGVRIIGYCLIPFSLILATLFLIISEIIGILEEMV